MGVYLRTCWNFGQFFGSYLTVYRQLWLLVYNHNLLIVIMLIAKQICCTRWIVIGQFVSTWTPLPHVFIYLFVFICVWPWSCKPPTKSPFLLATMGASHEFCLNLFIGTSLCVLAQVSINSRYSMFWPRFHKFNIMLRQYQIIQAGLFLQ